MQKYFDKISEKIFENSFSNKNVFERIFLNLCTPITALIKD